LKTAPVHCVVVWHDSQVCENPAAAWFGFVVFWKSGKWHVEQAVPSPAYFPPTWQLAQATAVCLPVNGNFVVLWLNVAPAHCVVVWHDSQVVGKPAWLGFLAA